MKKRNRCLRVVLCLILGWACLLGCEGNISQTKNTKHGGVLYIGVETPFHGLDVLGLPGSGSLFPATVMLNSAIQEPLFRMDEAGNLIPVLGLSAAPSENGEQWDVTLRQNVSFHDGTAFNADAVVHHWKRMLNPENNFRGRKLIQPVQRVEKVDDYTVRFILAHHWAPFLKVISDELYLFNFIPSPRAVEEGVHDRKPVGTGPFKYSKWNGGDHYIVLKNPNYWRRDKPLLNKIVFRTVPDHQTRYASLASGQLDAITLDRGHLIKKSQKDPSLYTYYYERNGAETIRLNTRKPPLDDVRVRQALALANDQRLHIKLIYGDSIPFIQHPFGQWFKCLDNGYLEHDLERARQLISDYGRKVELEYVHTNTSRGRNTGEMLQQLYKKIGVSLNPIGLSIGPHVKKMITGDFQLASSRIYESNDLGPALYNRFHSNSPSNHSGYRNPHMDELLEAQRTEIDPEKRSGILCKIARRLNTDVPFLYRGGRRQNIVARKKIRNLVDGSKSRIDLGAAWIDEVVKFNIAAFEIEKKARISVDCTDPGDVEAVKAVILGAWEGKDDWGAAVSFTFKEDDSVISLRTGSTTSTTKYIICGQDVHWATERGAKVVASVGEGKESLEGEWRFGTYSGKFTLAAMKQ
ncbi:MAG: hypothetical protein GY859_21805 [Desulfobacterales bacterium]|nr:hypothetical protein [Desulfobacterales bacterium]